jgi:hypothetical protein
MRQDLTVDTGPAAGSGPSAGTELLIGLDHAGFTWKTGPVDFAAGQGLELMVRSLAGVLDLLEHQQLFRDRCTGVIDQQRVQSPFATSVGLRSPRTISAPAMPPAT